MSTKPAARRWLTTLWLALYYTVILASVIALHPSSNFRPPPFFWVEL